MALLLRTHIRLARESLRRTRSRSFLTCLGITIGVASIILILSLMGSITNLIKSEVGGIASDLIVIRPDSKKDLTSNVMEELTSAGDYRQSTLRLSDLKTIREVSNVAAVAPIATLTTRASEGDSRYLDSVTVLATTPDFNTIEPLTMKNGVFLNSSLQSNNTAVVGQTLAAQLFGNTSATGKSITLLGERFMIIGVITEQNDPINFNNVDLDHTAIININALAEKNIPFQIKQINVKAKATEELAATASAIETSLTTSRSGDQNFSVAYGENITHPAGSFFSIVSSILALVAGISLVVGGIGIMNIMLVSVSERSHEIGVRRAVGASRSCIFFQFLFESLILSILGGILGLVIAYVLAFLICLVTPFNPFISWQIIAVTFATSLTVGVIFGLYPAFKASRKSPIASLKSYH